MADFKFNGLYYDRAVGEIVLKRLAEGNSLSQIAESFDMPRPCTVLCWVKNVPSFAEKYKEAREMQVYALMDQVIDIADAAIDKNTAAIAKVKIDTRFKLAGKLLPNIFGDKTDINVNGKITLEQLVLGSLNKKEE